MAQETSKATERRLRTLFDGWDERIKGLVLDVGPGDDPLVWPGAEVVPFDKGQGDANKIDTHFQEQSFDCIHGSQVMEHLYNPADFIQRCLKLLRPGGWIVMTIPDLDLYERCQWPSRFNPDHKTTWSLWRKHWVPPGKPTRHLHVYVPHWITQFNVAQRKADLIHTNFDFLLSEDIDQTWHRENGVECWIEVLLQKHP